MNLHAIEKVDELHQSWGISTCGTERTIGVERATFTLYRKCNVMTKTNDALEIIFLENSVETEVPNIANELHLKMYGLCRKGNLKKLRINAGTEKKRDRQDAAEVPSTEIGYRRARDHRAKESAGTNARTPWAALIRAGGISEAHSDVAAFEAGKENKCLKRKLNEKLRNEASRNMQ